MNIGSNAGPERVSPTIPSVVTPTLCATKLKSLSEVYTPGDTNTLFAEAILLNIYFLFYLFDKYYQKNERANTQTTYLL
jgi:hypothetical protein